MSRRKLFVDGKHLNQQAYFGWQDQVTALIGIKMGYKNSADHLVDIALAEGELNRIRTLDTYIFPIVFSYRHAIEASLKLIYRRVHGKIQPGGHDLIVLWDKIKKEVIDLFEEAKFMEDVKSYKENYRKYDLSSFRFEEIRELMKEFNEIDNKADVFRYLQSKDGQLYFTSSKYIDYPNLKETMHYIYETLDYIFNIADDYLSS